MKTTFVNAHFHTMRDEGDVKESMTVNDGVIVGFDRAANGRTVDLGGAHVYPAMTDAHLHMLDAIALDGVGIEICRIADEGVEPRTLDGVERMIRAHAARHKGPLMVFTNYISAVMDVKRLPTRFELDEWTGGAAAWVLNIDGHSSSCSSALLERAALPDAPEDGILAGPSHDANLGVFTGLMASCITPSILARGIAHFCNECARYGIATVCALEGTDDSDRDRSTEMIAALAQRFPIDVRLFPQYMDRTKLASVDARMKTPRVGGCMKWELDGSVGSRTAAFRDPYRDGSTGELYFSDDELRAAVAAFAQEGRLVSAHTIGERAIDQLLSIYENVPGRHRIDHCEFPAPDALERIYALSPFVTVQPGYAWIDKRYLHGYETFLSAEQIARQIPLRDMARRGVVLCGSSDAPVQSVDPFLQMRGMRDFYLPEQSLTAYEALRTYTVNGGIMLGETKGLLEEGYEASFFTTERDLLTMAPEELAGMHADALYLRGKAYRALPDGIAALARLACSKKRAI